MAQGKCSIFGEMCHWRSCSGVCADLPVLTLLQKNKVSAVGGIRLVATVPEVGGQDLESDQGTSSGGIKSRILVKVR